MLNVTELKHGAVFKEDGQILQVLTYEHNKMGRGSGNVRVKVRNLKTGSVVEKTFITGARVDEALIEKRVAQYLYHDSENYYFMDPGSFEQFPLTSDGIADQARFLKDGMEVQLIVLDSEALGIELPNSLVYEIIETGPGEKGNSVSNVFKSAVLDNGLEVRVPMFMKIGDKVKIDTRTGQYVERISK